MYFVFLFSQESSPLLQKLHKHLKRHFDQEVKREHENIVTHEFARKPSPHLNHGQRKDVEKIVEKSFSRRLHHQLTRAGANTRSREQHKGNKHQEDKS